MAKPKRKPRRKRAPKAPAGGAVIELTGQQCQAVVQLLDQLGRAKMSGRVGVARALMLQEIRPYSRAVAESLSEKMVAHGGTAQAIGPEAEGYQAFLDDPEVAEVLEETHVITLPKLIQADDAAHVEAPGALWQLLIEYGLIVV